MSIFFLCELDFSFFLTCRTRFVGVICRVLRSTSRNFATVLVGDHWIWMIVQWLMSLKPIEISSLR